MLTPSFSELSDINERALVSRLDAVRAVLNHAGEKGRSLEGEVAAILREVLPTSYGLSTGFVAYKDKQGEKVQLSPQLDLIIYDAHRSGPLARLRTCEVFPLEAVLAYIEVKAMIRSTSDFASEPSHDSLEGCLDQNRRLRALTTRRFWAATPGTTTRIALETHDWVPIRGFVFAFEAHGSVAMDPSRLAQRMADYSRQLGSASHLHGLFVAGKGYFRMRAVEPSLVGTEAQHIVEYVTEHALLEFTVSLLRALNRFPRPRSDWTPAIDQYCDEPHWLTCAPD